MPAEPPSSALQQPEGASGDAVLTHSDGDHEGDLRQREVLSGLRVDLRLQHADGERREHEWFKGGQNIERARQLFREAGYDGKPIVLLSASNVQHMTNAGLLYQQWLRAAGCNVELVTSDWGAWWRGAPTATRRTRAAGTSSSPPPPARPSRTPSRWRDMRRPARTQVRLAVDERNEQLRDAWSLAATAQDRLAIARQMQENAWNYVPHVHYGQWVTPSAMRANLRGLIAMPELVPFWNVERV